jgi:mRNA interferase RelE/StbE
MVDLEVVIDVDAKAFLDRLPKKSRDIVKAKLHILTTNPFLGKGGDKELLYSPKHKEVYRLHISRSYTAFYRIEGNTVLIQWLGSIEQAHKLYGRYVIR